MPRSTKSQRKSERPKAARESIRTTRDAAIFPLLDEVQGSRVLCTSLSRGDLAAELAHRCPDADVVCAVFDVFLAEQARETIGDQPRATVSCEADLPAGSFDTVVMPFLKNGEAELTRELLQQAHERLPIGGQLLASIDNPRDRWLHEQIETLFGRVTKRPQPRGTLYLATKAARLKRIRDFTAEFAFRDGERLVRAVSRPGVFSHRELDLGARALLEATSSDDAVQPSARILDLGCGAGSVGIALALRAPGVHVHAIDSNPRAIQCTRLGAERNGIRCVARLPATRGGSAEQSPTLSTQLDAGGDVPRPGTFDLVMANPPYYSNWAIATIFVEAAARALRPDGRLYLVTKHADWYQTNLPFVMSDVAVRTVRGYAIVTARPRRSR